MHRRLNMAAGFPCPQNPPLTQLIFQEGNLIGEAVCGSETPSVLCRDVVWTKKKKRRSLKSCKTDDFGTKTQKFICPLQLVLALGAFFCLLYPGSNSLCLLDLLFSNKLSGGLSQQTDILAEPYQLHTERLIVRISISAWASPNLLIREMKGAVVMPTAEKMLTQF